jgi:putative PIN family toxin of toxin-antitoxin system
VLDTNLLVGSAYAPDSSSRRIVEACLRGEVVAVLSPALRAEYDFILRRAVRGRADASPLRRLIEQAEEVSPAETPRVVPDDPDDDKLVAAARAAGADALVTNDAHLLALDPLGGLRVMRPAEFVHLWLAPRS